MTPAYTQAELFKLRKNHYAPCLTCKAPTQHWSALCPNCREVKCQTCKRAFKMQPGGPRRCGECQKKYLRKVETGAFHAPGRLQR